ncbi:hypothetical protein NW768_011537 [Fusarium equiseti]|uniref:Uncharacterized protein n=1 Tax=Fusarium equiseti TaxID=61235 RepID=A0ABQ8QXA3_FUSEQ|nr:hypothetical protein NW768_011537 [Fusarium equiseti]
MPPSPTHVLLLVTSYKYGYGKWSVREEARDPSRASCNSTISSMLKRPVKIKLINYRPRSSGFGNVGERRQLTHQLFLNGIAAQQQQSISLLADERDVTVREGAATPEAIAAFAQETNTNMNVLDRLEAEQKVCGLDKHGIRDEII